MNVSPTQKKKKGSMSTKTASHVLSNLRRMPIFIHCDTLFTDVTTHASVGCGLALQRSMRHISQSCNTSLLKTATIHVTELV